MTWQFPHKEFGYPELHSKPGDRNSQRTAAGPLIQGEPTAGPLEGSGANSKGEWVTEMIWKRWAAGTASGGNTMAIGKSDCALAAAAAGALAVGQAFLAEQGDHRAGRSMQQLSLWAPELGGQGAYPSGPGLDQVYLPTVLWLVGLGNLGQAYLWSLTLLPYKRPEDVLLFFQDDQNVGKENWGTSVLVQKG